MRIGRSSHPATSGNWWAFSLIAVLVLPSTTTPGQQQRIKLTKIQVEGLERLSQNEVVSSSGLKVDQSYSVQELDAAAQRLVDTGQFKRVAYRTRTVSGSTTIVFQVEELKGAASAVVFDNFVWFSDQELTDAVRREIPSFNGTASNVGTMTDLITRALQKLLSDRNLPGTIEYMPSQRGNTVEHFYSVTGVKMPICKLHFPGSRIVSEDVLVQISKDLTAENYSRLGTSVFASYKLFLLYRDVGHLRATFGNPIAKLAPEPNCKDGIDLTIPVDEGPVYSWDKAEWSGNQAMSATSLDDGLGMKKGEVASGLKFDQGLANLRKLYGRKGHLLPTFDHRLDLDDAARLATGKIRVAEGPQFRMGGLFVKGFSQGEELFIREKWRLSSGDIFDQGYLEEFIKTSLGIAMNSAAQRLQAEGKDLPKNVETGARPNRKTLTVDVVFEIN